MTIIFPKRKKTLKRYIRQKIYNITHRYYDFKWYIKNNILNPGNKINIKSIGGSYCEPDVKLLHANFQILVDFVEKEWKVFTSTDLVKKIIHKEEISEDTPEWCLEQVKEQNKTNREIFNLYLWWKHRESSRIDVLDNIPEEIKPIHEFVPCEDRSGCSTMVNRNPRPEYEKLLRQSMQQDEDWRTEDQDMLHKLIDLRPNLWT